MSTFDYTVETSKKFDEAVAAVEAKTQEKGFRVLAIHDVKGTLESKGFSRESMKIIEICNAKYVDQVLKKDIRISLMLPCPIVVYTESGKNYISALRPRSMVDFFPDSGIESIAAEVDDIVLAVVNEAK
jgi:uncharacterized protein (DUF302 family)